MMKERALQNLILHFDMSEDSFCLQGQQLFCCQVYCCGSDTKHGAPVLPQKNSVCFLMSVFQDYN